MTISKWTTRGGTSGARRPSSPPFEPGIDALFDSDEDDLGPQ